MILHLARFYHVLQQGQKKIEFQLVILQENDLPKPLPIGLMMLISLVQTDYETGNCLSPAHRFRAFPLPVFYSLSTALMKVSYACFTNMQSALPTVYMPHSYQDFAPYPSCVLLIVDSFNFFVPQTSPVRLLERSAYSASFCFMENLHRR